MHTFRTLDKQLGRVPGTVATAIGGIDHGRGREEMLRQQHPQALETLVDVARIQSTEASNAIEHITAPRKRIEELVAEKTTPANRSEEEIAGYRAALDTIHNNAPDIPFTPKVVQQFHRDLYQYTNVPAGRWKNVDNAITQENPDGSSVVRFRTVSAFETPRAMEELHERFTAARDDGRHHPALLVGCYVFDFLAIHPFRDGNGRMARLLTLLSLYQAGYGVVRYISLERLINETRETYYDALEAAGRGWHEDAHDIMPWLHYFLGIVTRAYVLFEERVGQVGGRGSKVAAIENFVRTNLSDVFTFRDVCNAVPIASERHVSNTLQRLRRGGVIQPEGAGRGARWRRLKTDF
jgi:Fic family protein